MVYKNTKYSCNNSLWLFLVAYVIWSLIEYFKDNKPCGTRISLHVLCPLTLGGALYVVFFTIAQYVDPEHKINVRELWNTDVLFAFIVLCISFSFIGANIYRIIRVITNPKGQVVYTATCIPINKTGDNGITFYLIKNVSHSTSQWMFPGGHVIIENNFIGKNESDYLQRIKGLPADVALKKCINEVNIDIEYIDFVNNKYVGGNDLSKSEECSQALAPVFNMKFLVSEFAKCHERFGHRIHYDFTYVAKYKKRNDKISNYQYIEICFQLKEYTFDNEKKVDEISRITSKIHTSIGSGDMFKQFFSSIPLLIYETLKLFNKNDDRLSLLDK